MSKSDLGNLLFKLFFSVREKTDRKLINPKNFLIVRQHNQFGDMLASVSLFRAIKETYPESKIALITSPDNYFAVEKNKFIDSQFCYDKSKILSFSYIKSLKSFLRKKYDVVIVPSTVSLSFTSHFLGRLARAETRICAASLNGEQNQFSYLCDRRIDLNWKLNPSSNVSEFILEIVKPFGINTINYKSEISFSDEDKKRADEFINEEVKIEKDQKLIGIHTGAGKTPNRWKMEKFVNLSERLVKDFNCKLYFTGSSSDKEQIDFLKNNLTTEKAFALNKKITELAAIIANSDLFITNDTGVMHVAGAVDVNQISLFGPTDPQNWAPAGKHKFYIRKAESIDDIDVDDVYDLAKNILEGRKWSIKT